ncbi:MAG: thiamine-phosphate kinase [Cyanobacteria bacterium P01_H01_bin.58]
MGQPTVADVGELGLLARLQPFCDPSLIGDDAAVIFDCKDGFAQVITTDVLVDGVHFSDRTTSAMDVGWRAIAANLSDLAAMGASPIGVTVGLSLPGSIPVAWVEGLYEGMSACLSRYGGTILGGDICRATQTAVAITALGQVSPGQVIRRDRAQPGQVIVATGYHGASRAGLELLLHPDRSHSLNSAEQQRLIQAHQRPTPRLDVVQHLQTLIDVDFAHVAGMDSSDGLANAVLQLCQASGVGAKLVRPHLPIPAALATWVGDATALDWCLYGGEDFELVLCLPAAIATELLTHLGQSAAIIGTLTPEPDVVLVEAPLSDIGSTLTWESCFQHF